ncbi:type 1 glutamine amidotransferase domain-containing protein [Tautonia plasticadhaerens]
MTVAILVADAFEQVALTGLRKALDAVGAKTVLVAPHPGQVRAWNLANWGDMFDVDRPLGQARAEQFDAQLLPGGVGNTDLLRVNGDEVKFVRASFDAGKPVASICHGPWSLIEAGVVKGRRMTAWPSLKTDLQNARATWENKEAVTDNNLVTSRMPADIPAFNRHMIDLFAAGKPGTGSAPSGTARR